MFERWVGEEGFRKGVQRYLKAHAWGNATRGRLRRGDRGGDEDAGRRARRSARSSTSRACRS